MPGLGLWPLLAMTGWERGWAWGGRHGLAMSCPQRCHCEPHRGVAIQPGWYRRSGERSRGCPCVRWIAASGLWPLPCNDRVGSGGLLPFARPAPVWRRPRGRRSGCAMWCTCSRADRRRLWLLLATCGSWPRGCRRSTPR